MALEEKEIQALASAVESAITKAISPLNETIKPLVESNGKVFGIVDELKKDLINKRDRADGKASTVESENAELKTKLAEYEAKHKELETNFGKQGSRFETRAKLREHLKAQGVVDVAAFEKLHNIDDAFVDGVKWKEDGSIDGYDFAKAKEKTPYLFAAQTEPQEKGKTATPPAPKPTGGSQSQLSYDPSTRMMQIAQSHVKK